MAADKQVTSRRKHWALHCCFGSGDSSEHNEENTRPIQLVHNPPRSFELGDNLAGTVTATSVEARVEPSHSVTETNAATLFVPSTENFLWKRALDNFENSDGGKAIVSKIKDFEANQRANQNPPLNVAGEEIIRYLQKTIEEEDAEVEEKEKQWSFSLGQKSYSVREWLRKTVTFLQKIAPAGDVLASIDPTHAAGPWAIVRLILIFFGDKEKLTGDMVFGFAQVTTLIFLCENYQALYNDTISSSGTLVEYLQNSIVDAYVASLCFLGFADRLRNEGIHFYSATFKLADMKTRSENLFHARENLNESADICQHDIIFQNQAMTREILQLAREMDEQEREVYRAVSSQRKLVLETHTITLLSQLKYVAGAAHDSFDNQHNPQCLEGTRAALLKQIYDWVDDSYGKRIFWLQGMAGTGKSTISRTVATTLRDMGNLGASFFFKRGEGDRSRAKYFFTTISKQLCHEIPSFAEHVQKVIAEDSLISDRNIQHQFEKLINNPLRAVSEATDQRQRIIVVVDALDECENDDHAASIISLLSRVESSYGVDWKVFVTSRPDRHINLGFKKIDGSYLDIALHDLPITNIEHDISLYLSNELEKIKDNMSDNTYNMENWPNDADFFSLLNMTSPLFISAATICRFLGSDLQSDPVQGLQDILNRSVETLDDQLNATYAPVLDRLAAGGHAALRKRIASNFRDIVGPLVILAEPLSATCLVKILKLKNSNDLDTLLRRLKSVFQVPKDSELPIKMYHLSFREYLVNDGSGVEESFRIDERRTHKELSTKCLDLLLRDENLKYNMCELETPGSLRNETGGAELDNALQYACLYWVYHLREGGGTINDDHQVHKFLRLHFLHWLEALSLMGRVSESIKFIQELQAAVEPSGSVRILKFLNDMNRFIARFGTVVSELPLQAYAALLFAPQRSIVREVFEPHRDYRDCIDWISIQPITEYDWNPCLRVLESPARGIDTIAFSGDGKLIVSTSRDETTTIWNVATGEIEHTFEPGGLLTGFSSDNKLVVSSTFERQVSVWNAATGELQHSFYAGEYLESFAFSSVEDLVASVIERGTTIQFWSSVTGEMLHTLDLGEKSARCIAFAADGKLMATGSAPGRVGIWSRRPWTLQSVFVTDWLGLDSMAFSTDNKLIALFSRNHPEGPIRVYETSGTNQCKFTIDPSSFGPTSFAFLGDNKLLAAGMELGQIKIWDTTERRVKKILEGHSASIQSISFSTSSNLLATASAENTIRIWESTKELPQNGHNLSECSQLLFSPDSELLAFISYDTIKIWASRQGKVQYTLPHDRHIQSITFAANSTMLASELYDNTVKIWDAREGKLQHSLPHDTSLRSVKFSPDSKLLASISEQKIHIWDAKQGSLQYTVSRAHQINSFTFSPDSKLLAFTSNKMAQICDASQGKLLYEPTHNSVDSILFSPNSNLLVTRSHEAAVKIWDASKGILHYTIYQTDYVKSMIFSSDCALLASYNGRTLLDSYDIETAVKIWDVNQGQLLQSFNVQNTVRSVRFADNCLQGSIGLDFPFSIVQIKEYPDDQADYEIILCADGKTQVTPPREYDLSGDNAWILRDGRNALSIPIDWRLGWCEISPSGKFLALAQYSGKVLFMGFK